MAAPWIILGSRRAGIVLASVLAAASGPAAAEQINIFNWSDYIGETTLDDFTAATGIETTYATYDSNEVMEAQLLAGNAGYDIVVPTLRPFLDRLIEAGVFQPLDLSKIPNWDNLDPALMERTEPANPEGEYAAIYQWGTNGFGYNVDMIRERLPDAPVESWHMIFDPEIVSRFEDCGVSLLDSPSEVFPIALHYLGLDQASEDPEDLARAEELLLSIRPYVRYFHSSQYINDLATGNLCLALGWSGDVFIAQDRAAEADNGQVIDYTIPREGTIIWFDMIAIPADAPNPDGAHAFINFVLDPQVMAGITNYVYYPNAVPASLEYIEEEIRDNPDIYPPDEVRDRLFAVETVSPRYERLRTRAWTRVRTGQ